jgi:beta-galactosidase/beta-glucuronidase
MKKISLLALINLVSFFNLTDLSAQISFGSPEKINNDWLFALNPASFNNHTQTPDFDESNRQRVDLPHDWSVRQPLNSANASCQGFLPGGIGWYRKTIFIPQDRQNQKIHLYFEGVYNRSEVFVNGQLIGSRPNGYISFAYDITPYVQFGKDNEIVVRVDHSQNADSRWYTGSGIYRNVWLVYANPVHLAQWGVFAFCDNLKDLKVEVAIVNESSENASLTIINELFSPEGKSVAKNAQKIFVETLHTTSLQTQLSLKNPQLWDLEHPNLYTLKTTVLQNGKKIDETSTTTGFRSFTFDPDKGFSLNGKNLKIKGVCLHHDAGVLGAAVPREVWKRRLQTLKEIGVNALRTSHNPQAPDWYDLCDELGLLVLNEAYDEWEFPKNKWIEGWNVGTPGHQGSFDIFEKWGEQDLADMVRRDRNHVSVFAWSIGNEVDYPNDPYSHPILDGENKDFTQKLNGGYQKDAPDANRLGGIAKRLVAVVKQYDKSRPVTAGLAGVAMSNETEYPFALDICGYNYTENRYISDHQKYPDRVIFGSETRHDLPAWKAVTDNPHIFGQFLWTGMDYLGESGKWPSRGFYSGLVDFAGFIKPRGYFRKALWSDEPVLYLGTYINHRPQSKPSMDAWPVWNYEEGEIIRVVCYTNAEKAQLLLNDQPVGETKTGDSQTGIIDWDIPYHAGKLEVRGFNGDKETARYVIRTSGQPHAIKAVTVPSNDGHVWHMVLQVVDEKGIPVLSSENEITCKIEGSARLLGLEAGNNSDMGDYTDNVQRALYGRLLAYIQTTGQAGEIKVIFTAPGLKPEEVKLEN